ncbi:MAG: archease [Desulfobacterales bacterium]|nr:archease [Desulfobacterales bacterium]
MPYRFIDDIATADIAFEAFGATLDEVFAAAAEALLDAMLNNPEALDIAKRENLILEAESAEMLLFDFLQELVFLKDRDQALLRAEEVVVAPHGDGYRLQAVLSGERLDYARHDLVVDVKAVTMHQFKLVPAENGWQARVVVDI